jgi:hypothetical protein
MPINQDDKIRPIQPNIHAKISNDKAFGVTSTNSMDSRGYDDHSTLSSPLFHETKSSQSSIITIQSQTSQTDKTSNPSSADTLPAGHFHTVIPTESTSAGHTNQNIINHSELDDDHSVESAPVRPMKQNLIAADGGHSHPNSIDFQYLPSRFYNNLQDENDNDECETDSNISALKHYNPSVKSSDANYSLHKHSTPSYSLDSDYLMSPTVFQTQTNFSYKNKSKSRYKIHQSGNNTRYHTLRSSSHLSNCYWYFEMFVSLRLYAFPNLF